MIGETEKLLSRRAGLEVWQMQDPSGPIYIIVDHNTWGDWTNHPEKGPCVAIVTSEDAADAFLTCVEQGIFTPLPFPMEYEGRPGLKEKIESGA
jgi:hypothetical protein